jgi:hypothetical protein
MLTRNGWACNPLVSTDRLRAVLIGQRPLLDASGIHRDIAFALADEVDD